MRHDHEPRFSELIFENEQREMPVPPRDSAAAREDGADGRSRKQGKPGPKGGRTEPVPPRQISLWEEASPGPGRSSAPANGPGRLRGEAPVPARTLPPAGTPQARIPGRPPSPAERPAQPLRQTAGPGNRPPTTESLFAERAGELATYREPEAEFVPFKSYWPTYGHMDRHQTKWYFYWRNEVREGRYPKTDLSYIFLHVYELINGVGWETPEDGARQLNAIWEAYRHAYKRLDQYLGGWIADFSLVHGLKLPLGTVVERSRGLAGDLGELELERCLTAAPDELTLAALQMMSDYDLSKSKFFEGDGEEALRRWVPKTVALVDAYILRTHGQRLIEMFPPEPAVMRERYLFRSAVYDISLYGYSVVVPVVRVSKTPALRSLVTRIFRLTENKLRALMGYKGRLKGISIDPAIKELVEKYLDREYARSLREQAGPAVVIDRSRLERLQSDSDTVRELLTIEAPEEEADAPAPIQPESGRPPGAEGEAPEEPDAEGEVPEEPQAGGEALEEPDAGDGPGLSLPPEAPAEWRDFLDALPSSLHPVLQALAGENGREELAQAAAAAGRLPELAVDEINDAAMEHLGDLLIDGDQWNEEFAELQTYVKR
ncbi:hypothetical protein F4V43_12355 [Paenibacillus spiritus]|uniref:TerB N-terminal domain-containing protein n=1 Tax=Paenibacillus spiritus TaxID=2496557 RepID=A0A5J5G8N1_9BACL|nr:TerB N-terminal domain-containing protein [Paenibacillus spiritus]KAA9004180.1 hypothetical protein F4V43_12355 [Paenibacillus spiritus]